MAHMINRHAKEIGKLLEAEFVWGSHAVFPWRPLLGRDAEGFGAFFAAASTRELLHAFGSDVCRDDLTQFVWYSAH